MRRRRTIVLLPVLAALAAAGAGCGGDDDTSGGEAAGTQATIKTFMFEPDPIEVDAGTTVTWTNEDDILHTVTSTKSGGAAAFDERLNGAGTSAEVSFDEPGTYEYICAVHDGMEGSVVVR
jgi:plastocyanin